VATKKQRQRQLARDAHKRRMQRQTERDRRAKQWAAGAIVAVIVVGVGLGAAAISGVFSPAKAVKPTAAGASSSATASPSPTPSPASTAAMVGGKCIYTPSGVAARKVKLPSAVPDTKASYVATIKTNRGTIVIDLLNSKAPCTVNSFVSLADQGFYNKTPCPRLSTESGVYMLQCGDPTGTMEGGPGYEFGSENLTGASYTAGVLAMATNLDVPDSNGSQFFVIYKNSELTPDYTPFGQVVSGLTILQNVAKHGFGPPLSQAGGGAPKESVEIDSVTIKKT
jgi:peptidyl-prolyl cis-trans isomerase B (cyclophilin B)